MPSVPSESLSTLLEASPVNSQLHVGGILLWSAAGALAGMNRHLFSL